jgi:Zn-finger nucleic acid-binding protein
MKSLTLAIAGRELWFSAQLRRITRARNASLSCRGSGYRFYDLEMEFCPNQHGYWLDHDEDTRVLELMKREEADLQRKLLAEEKWTATLRHMRSPSFFSKLRDLFHK